MLLFIAAQTSDDQWLRWSIGALLPGATKELFDFLASHDLHQIAATVIHGVTQTHGGPSKRYAPDEIGIALSAHVWLDHITARFEGHASQEMSAANGCHAYVRGLPRLFATHYALIQLCW